MHIAIVMISIDIGFFFIGNFLSVINVTTYTILALNFGFVYLFGTFCAEKKQFPLTASFIYAENMLK